MTKEQDTSELNIRRMHRRPPMRFVPLWQSLYILLPATGTYYLLPLCRRIRRQYTRIISAVLRYPPRVPAYSTYCIARVVRKALIISCTVACIYLTSTLCSIGTVHPFLLFRPFGHMLKNVMTCEIMQL
jgi:hypothetical protein